jgi:hypothetical protein
MSKAFQSTAFQFNAFQSEAVVASLSGSIVGLGTYSGSIVRKIEVAGYISGLSVFSGSLTKKIGIHGNIEGISSFSGLIKTKRILSGNIVGAGFLSGDLRLNYIQLGGSLNGLSNIRGSLKATNRRNLRVCEIVDNNKYYYVLIAIKRSKEVNKILQAWAIEKFGYELDLPTALVSNKDITEVISYINFDLDEFVYLAR